MFEDLPEKSIVNFVTNATFFSMLYHGAVMSGQLRASESFFSYFRVEIVGPIFLSFLKKKNKPDFSM